MTEGGSGPASTQAQAGDLPALDPAGSGVLPPVADRVRRRFGVLERFAPFL